MSVIMSKPRRWIFTKRCAVGMTDNQEPTAQQLILRERQVMPFDSSIPKNLDQIPTYTNTLLRKNHFERSESILGITTKSASTRENTNSQDNRKQTTLDNNISKYTLQDYVRKLMPKHRTSACMCALAHGQDNVEIHMNLDKGHAHYRNLMVCDNKWTCAVCASREASYRAQEISFVTAQTDYDSIMVTYTMRHHRFDRLESTLEKIKTAHRKFKSGRKYQTFKENYGIVGTIKSLEITWGDENGWHPHIHELFFFDKKQADFDLETKESIIQKWMKDDFANHWIHCVSESGGTANYANGLDVRTGDDFVREYIAKHGKMPEKTGWTIERELTQSNVKKGTGEHLTPFQILERTKGDKESPFSKLWFEYVDATHGSRQLVWSAGLKELVGLEEITDAMVLDIVEGEKECVAVISSYEWISICHMKKRAELLNLAIMSGGDKKRLRREIEKIGKDHSLEINKSQNWRKIQLPDHIKKP